MSRRFVAVAALVAAVVCAGPASARRLTVVTSKTETLNAGSTQTDCSELSKTPDAALPMHIVRISVTPPAGVSGLVRYQWSLPTPNLGTLVADQDIPQGEQAAVIQALCAEVGNECALTEEQLKIYDKTTILWVAPTCDAVLPTDATKPYRGGQVKIGVKAFAGKHKAGKGTVSVGFGRVAGVTMGINGKTGNGKAVDAGLEAQFSATVDARGVTLPSIDDYEFENGDGDAANVPTNGLQASTVLEYATAGKHIGTTTVQLHDGSALCDNILGNVLTSDNRISLTVTTAPQGVFRPGDPQTGVVNLRVRVKNTSDPAVARGVVLLEGANVLSCDTEIKVGTSTLTKSTSIDFQHCSATVDQGCQSDDECSQHACPACQTNEVCLAASHCALGGVSSGFAVRGCVRDADCGPGGECVKVLPVTSLVLPIGDSSELLNVQIPVANTLSGTAKVKETWTVHARNAADASDSVSYSITSNPGLRP
jgi:hypothetical protein